MRILSLSIFDQLIYASILDATKQIRDILLEEDNILRIDLYTCKLLFFYLQILFNILRIY